MRIKFRSNLKFLNLITDIIGLSIILISGLVKNISFIQMLILVMIGFSLIKLDIE